MNLNLFRGWHGIKDLADHPAPTSHLTREETEAQSGGGGGCQIQREKGKEEVKKKKKEKEKHARLMGWTHIEKLLTVNLEFVFNWEFCVSSGTFHPVIFFHVNMPKDDLNITYD